MYVDDDDEDSLMNGGAGEDSEFEDDGAKNKRNARKPKEAGA